MNNKEEFNVPKSLTALQMRQFCLQGVFSDRLCTYVRKKNRGTKRERQKRENEREKDRHVQSMLSSKLPPHPTREGTGRGEQTAGQPVKMYESLES